MSILARVYYYFKTNCLRYFSFLFSFVFACILSFIFFPKIIKNKSYYKVYKSCKTDNIWFAGSPSEYDCFYNYNGIDFVYLNENRVLDADIFMQLDSLEYKNNTFNIDYELSSNQCAISRNLAYEYKIHIGDSLLFFDKEFKIEKIFNSQEGIDDKYYHKGVIVLSFESDIKKPGNYICFLKNTEAVYDADRFVSISYKTNKYHSNYIVNCCVYFSLSLLVIILGELLVFRGRGKDYLLYMNDGINKIMLFWIVLEDSLIKILVPFTFAALIFYKYLFAYHMSYMFILINAMSFQVLLAFGDTFIYLFRRNKRWKH